MRSISLFADAVCELLSVEQLKRDRRRVHFAAFARFADYSALCGFQGRRSNKIRVKTSKRNGKQYVEQVCRSEISASDFKRKVCDDSMAVGSAFLNILCCGNFPRNLS